MNTLNLHAKASKISKRGCRNLVSFNYCIACLHFKPFTFGVSSANTFYIVYHIIQFSH